MARVHGRGLALVLVAVIAAAVAGASPSVARADDDLTPFERLSTGSSTTDDRDAFWGLVRDDEMQAGVATAFAGYSFNKRASILTRLMAARKASRLLPPGGAGTALTRLTLIGTAAYVGWRVHQHFTSGDQDLDMWLDSAGLGSDSLYNHALLAGPNQNLAYWQDAGWEHVTGTGAGACPSGYGGFCYVLYLDPVWGDIFGNPPTHVTFSNGGSFLSDFYGSPVNAYAAFADYSEACGTLNLCTANDAGLNPGPPGKHYAQNLYAIQQTLAHLTSTNPDVGVHAVSTYASGAGTRYAYVLTEAEFGAGLSTVAPPGGGTFAPTITTDYTVPSDQGDADDLADGIAVFNTPCGRAWINYVVEPATYPFPTDCTTLDEGVELDDETVPLLRPGVNETVDDYIVRLQEAGWLGEATLSELDAPDEGVGPDAPSRVRVGTRVYQRTNWPNPSPRLGISTDITVFHNPSTVPPVDDPGGSGVGTPEPTAGDCPCPVHTLELDAFSQVEICGKFPFGVMCWMGTTIADVLTIDAEPPAVTWPAIELGTFLGVELALPEFTLDAAELPEPFLAFIDVMRVALTFVVWLVGIWIVGPRILGFRGRTDSDGSGD